MLNPILGLQLNLGVLKIVPYDSSYPKHGDRHQNQVSSITTSKVRNLHPEGVLDLLQPLHPVLDLQVDLRTLAMVPTDSSYPKTWG